jgi:hypothetical protein
MKCEVCAIVAATLEADGELSKGDLVAATVIRTVIFLRHVSTLEDVEDGICANHRRRYEDCLGGLMDVLKEKSEGSG